MLITLDAGETDKADGIRKRPFGKYIHEITYSFPYILYTNFITTSSHPIYLTALSNISPCAVREGEDVET